MKRKLSLPTANTSSKRRRIGAHGFVVCVSDDLKTDADLYAAGGGYSQPDNFSDICSGEVAIIYTHGQYYLSTNGGLPKANNKILWGGEPIDAVAAAHKIINELQLPNIADLTLIIHACFTAGTIERLPKAQNATDTFAGQLCSALSTDIPGITVIGYQGQSKAGKAGFPVGAGMQGRTTRAARDAHEGGRFSVEYSIGNGGVVISKSGDLVRWR